MTIDQAMVRVQARAQRRGVGLQASIGRRCVRCGASIPEQWSRLCHECFEARRRAFERTRGEA